MEILVEQSVLQATRAQIQREIDAVELTLELSEDQYELFYKRRLSWKKYLDECKLAAYLDNFNFHFPGGTYRAIAHSSGLEDQVYGKIYKDDIDAGDPEYGGHSLLLLHQTPRQFYEVFDQVIDYNKISMRRFVVLDREYRRLERTKLVFPAYVHLVALGYSKIDLTY